MYGIAHEYIGKNSQKCQLADKYDDYLIFNMYKNSHAIIYELCACIEFKGETNEMKPAVHISILLTKKKTFAAVKDDPIYDCINVRIFILFFFRFVFILNVHEFILTSEISCECD